MLHRPVEFARITGQVGWSGYKGNSGAHANQPLPKKLAKTWNPQIRVGPFWFPSDRVWQRTGIVEVLAVRLPAPPTLLVRPRRSPLEPPAANRFENQSPREELNVRDVVDREHAEHFRVGLVSSYFAPQETRVVWGFQEVVGDGDEAGEVSGETISRCPENLCTATPRRRRPTGCRP